MEFDSKSRLSVQASDRGLRIEIAPPVSDRALRRRALLFGSALAAGGFLALLRLSSEWQLLARGARGSFPLALLVPATVAVLLGPLAVLGLLTLLFAEETIEVGRKGIVQEIEVFGRVRSVPFPEKSRVRLAWTRWPVSPWWTWTFVRLALRAGGQRRGVGATLGAKDKARLESVLRKAIE
ncbi:MAG: hypothetical protein ACRD16_04180 [Thermoanaerobaculia bacterium]